MDSALLTVITGAGACGVFVVLFVIGLVYPKGVVDDLREENRELKKAVLAERDRADSAVAAAQATRDIMAAIQFGQHLPSQLTPGQPP